MSTTPFDRAAADVYWASRQHEEGYQAFKLLRDEADQLYTAWTRRELTDPDARARSQPLATRLRQWHDETDYAVALFQDGFWESEEQGCPPFHWFKGRRGLLESQEDTRTGFFFCDYLVFVF
jgi:hypothetical protein